MSLRLTDCQATTTKITVTFSEDVNISNATFTVYDPSGTPNTPVDVTSGVTYDSKRHTATFTPPLTMKVGNPILVSVTGLQVGGITQDPLAIGAEVKSDLTIKNCVATPGLVVVFFSEALDTSPANQINDPNNTSNYSVQINGGVPIQPTSAFYDTTSGVNATFLQFAPNQLLAGQSVTVTVQNVTHNNVSIGNSGSNTFTTNVRGDGGNGGRNGNGRVKEITESVEDAVAYPILTEQVSFPPYAGGGPATGIAATVAGGAALGQSAVKAITDVLGWKVNASDPKGFIGALTQAFTLTEVEGHIEATWKPRTYAVQTDLGGGITGAQASLYTRAKAALDQSLPILDGLYPLDPDADPEYVKALRELARNQMTEIVKELGAVGGPSVLRVNTYFQILLGNQQEIIFDPPSQVQTDPDKVDGTLGTLRDTYGIYFRKNDQNNPFSNSIEDEQDITNFRVISDYTTSLLQSWISNGKFFLLGATPSAFFGTQLVLISRQFSVIAETVNEVRFALDSVFIGPSERQTLLLQFSKSSKLPAIFLEDLLVEIEKFFNVEGNSLLQGAGRISVTNNILPVVESFQNMVREARRPVNIGSLPDGFRTIRVQRTLDDLLDQLTELISLVQPVGQQVPPPLEEPGALQVVSVSPVSVISGKTVTTSISIMGAGFVPVVTFDISPNQADSPAVSPINAATQFLNQNLLAARITIRAAANAGQFTYNVTVTNPDETQAQGELTITVIDI